MVGIILVGDRLYMKGNAVPGASMVFLWIVDTTRVFLDFASKFCHETGGPPLVQTVFSEISLYFHHLH